ncbi:MAG: glycosyltransferase family 2 protein [Flavobacteriales bacterium]|nr:glycosyltransferase family 2 protein [Flavobacteriales bacterium]
MQPTPVISIVSPVYRAESIVDKLVEEIQSVMEPLGVHYEIVLVDDRSPDNSWVKMKELAQKHEELKCIRLSRNYGQHPAIMAGLTKAKGEWVVVMDCDLQDNPKEIKRLYEKALEGFEVVLARRVQRQDRFFKKLSSKIFSKVYSYFSGVKYDNEVANFGIYHKKVIQSVLQITDVIKFFPLFVKEVGYNSTAIEVEHGERYAGETTYSLKTLISLAFNTIISFSNKPLKLFVKFGLLVSALAFLVGAFYLYQGLTGQIIVSGYTSLIVSIWFLSGVIITTIGITGIYIGKIFDQTKQRPVFIIDEEA